MHEKGYDMEEEEAYARRPLQMTNMRKHMSHQVQKTRTRTNWPAKHNMADVANGSTGTPVMNRFHSSLVMDGMRPTR